MTLLDMEKVDIEKTADCIENQIFADFTSTYDDSVGQIHLKIVHTYAVAEIIDRLTAELGLDERMRRLAHITAIFHDIGRFEQVRIYHTFLDHLSVDHAELGCEILEQKHLLDFLPEQDQEMVITAVRNHNKLHMDSTLTGDTLLLSKLIRDADKCDIYRVFATDDLMDSVGKTLEETEKEAITDIVYESVMNGQCVDKRVRKTSLDKWVGFLALMNDMNFPETIAIVKEAGYYRVQFDKAHFELEESRERIQAIFEKLGL